MKKKNRTFEKKLKLMNFLYEESSEVRNKKKKKQKKKKLIDLQ